MTNVNDIKNDFDVLINAAQQGNYTPEVLNILINNAVEGLYKQRLGLPEQYDMQQAIPKIAYARTEKIHTDLLPFRKRKRVVLTSSEFIDTTLLPSDLYYQTSVKYYTTIRVNDTDAARKLNMCGCHAVEEDTDEVYKYVKYVGTLDLVEEDKWATRANSRLIKKPMYLPFYDGWKIHFPVLKPSYIEIEYLKRPTRAKWNWIFDDIQEIEVYNPVGSIHVEFDDMLRGEVVARMLKQYGIYTDDNKSIQVGQQLIEKGE